MVSHLDFNRLYNRVSLLEAYLAYAKPVSSLSIPITIIIENRIFTENVKSDTLNVEPFYQHVKPTDYHIFVRIYIHGKKDVVPKTEAKSGHGYYEFLYTRPFYSVFIIKNVPSFNSFFEHHPSPKMNTVDTTNIHNYVDLDRLVSLYFGYANTENDLDKNNLFKLGKNNGIFFIINDKEHKLVSNYITQNSVDFDKVGTIADENIDIYKSKHLKTSVNIEILPPLPTTATTTKPRPIKLDEVSIEDLFGRKPKVYPSDRL